MFARASKKRFMLRYGYFATIAFINNFVGLSGHSGLKLSSSNPLIPYFLPTRHQARSWSNKAVTSSKTSKSSRSVSMVLSAAQNHMSKRFSIYYLSEIERATCSQSKSALFKMPLGFVDTNCCLFIFSGMGGWAFVSLLFPVSYLAHVVFQ